MITEELLEILKDGFAIRTIKKRKDLIDEVLYLTSSCDVSVTLAERIWLVKNGMDIPPVCPSGKAKKWIDGNVGYRFCGRPTSCECARINHSQKISESKKSMTLEEIELANNKRKNTLIEKYGVEYNSQIEEVKNKKEQNNIAKYGVSSNLKVAEIKERIKKTNIAKYGVENPQQSSIIKEKTKNTNIERYGENYTILMNRDKFDEVMKERYGVSHALQSCDFKEKREQTNISRFFKKQYELLKNEFDRNLTIPEKFVFEILSNMGIKEISIRNRQIISPLELDFYLPEHKIAFEVCGLYWHSELGGEKSRSYHLKKLELCEKAGVRLITIFDDEIRTGVIKNKIEHSLGYSNRICGARSTIIKNISTKDAKSFLENNHIQGYCNSKVKIGAYFKNKLVAVMTFGSLRSALGAKSSHNNWELLRMATCGSVPGISSKLLEYFKSNYSPNSIISYCDRRWGVGISYKKMGMTFSHNSPPNYWYIQKNYGKRFHRYGFRKSELIKEGFDSSFSEWEIMQQKGFDRIWDCGHSKWIWTKE